MRRLRDVSEMHPFTKSIKSTKSTKIAKNKSTSKSKVLVLVDKSTKSTSIYINLYSIYLHILRSYVYLAHPDLVRFRHSVCFLSPHSSAIYILFHMQIVYYQL